MAKKQRWYVNVEGAEELQKMFANMSDEAEAILDEAAEKGAKVVLSTAKNTAAFKDRTGALRKSLRIKKEKTKAKNKVSYQIGPKYAKKNSSGGVNYGHLVEFGVPSRGIPARPFLRPALDENFSEIKKIMSTAIVDAMGRVD